MPIHGMPHGQDSLLSFISSVAALQPGSQASITGRVPGTADVNSLGQIYAHPLEQHKSGALDALADNLFAFYVQHHGDGVDKIQNGRVPGPHQGEVELCIRDRQLLQVI